MKDLILSLAGTLSGADVMFQTIRDRRDAYLKSVQESAAKKGGLASIPTNLDSVVQYLEQKLPGQKGQGITFGTAIFMTKLNLPEKMPTLEHIDDAFRRTEKARQKLGEYEPTFANPMGPIALILAVALAKPNEDWGVRTPSFLESIRRVQHFVDPPTQ